MQAKESNGYSILNELFDVNGGSLSVVTKVLISEGCVKLAMSVVAVLFRCHSCCL